MTNFLHAKYDSSGNQIDDPTVVIGQPSYATDPLTGAVTGLVGPGGVNANIATTGQVKNVGTKILGMVKGGGGSVATATFAGINPSTTVSGSGQFMTFGAALEVETDYEWVRFFFCNPSSAVAINSVSAVALADISNSASAIANASFAAPSVALFNGAAGASLPAGSTNLSSFLFTDKLYISNIPRTDGGTKPAIGMRVTFTSDVNGSATVMPYLNRSGSDWSVDGATTKLWTYVSNANTDLTTGSIAATASRTGNNPFFGIQYGSKRQVMSVLWVGDSITGGAALTNKKAYPFGAASCLTNSTIAKPIEFSICSIPGNQISAWRSQLEAAYAGPTGGVTGYASGVTNLDVLNPSHVMLSSWSVNNAPNTTITTAQINGIRQEVSRIAEMTLAKNMQFCQWTGIPKGTDTTYYTVAGDVTQRQAYNADAQTWGWFSSNMGNLLANGALGTNQGIAAAYTADGTHPNDAGDAVLATEGAKFVAKIAANYFMTRRT